MGWYQSRLGCSIAVSLNIQLRQAVNGDYDFLWRLHCDTLKPYVEEIWGWDEQWQADRFHQTFDAGKNQIIQFHKKDIGVVAVELRPHDVFLANIQISPQYQRRGIGKVIIGTILADASEKQLPVTLQVFKINPALHLYERLALKLLKQLQHIIKCLPNL